MNLHESPDIFLELIQTTAADRGIPAIYVEKDYWVTRVLRRLSESKFRDFVDSEAFVEMIADVRDWDRRSMPGATAWLDPPLREAMIVTDPENLWSAIGSEFRGNFKEMVYGDSVPTDAEVLDCLAMIGASLTRA